MPERIQLRRTKGWRKPEGAVVVARPSRWGNPFTAVPHHLIGPNWVAASSLSMYRGVRRDREAEVGYISSSRTDLSAEAVDTFRKLCHVRARDTPMAFNDWITPLQDHDLACWCPLSQPCHADVLLEIANEVAA